MKHRITLFSLFFTGLILLSGCGSLPDSVPQISLPNFTNNSLPNGKDIENANELLAAGKRREAATAYFSAANNYRSPERERLMLQSAELAAIFKDAKLTNRYLAPINFVALSNENKARFRFTQAQLALNDRNHREALRILPQRVNGLPEGLASKILSARLAAAKASGDRLSLVQELVMQEPKLKTNQEVKLNQDRIWNHIQQMPTSQISYGRKAIQHTVLRSWLDLGHITKNNQSNRANLLSELGRWQKLNSTHPGNRKIQSIKNTATSTITTPYRGGITPPSTNAVIKPAVKTVAASTRQANQIAVILPLTGNLAGISNALLSGIQDAQRQYAKNKELIIYNSANSSIGKVYQTALSKGASFVIGPFEKSKIATLSKGQLPIPTLSLNYAQRSSKNLYQFGLSPDDEAVQIAQFAINKGQRRVALVTPKSGWGQRLQNIMRDSIIERNGKVVLMESYESKVMDYLLLANKVAQRGSDIDAIIIAASPSQARRLYPALREKINNVPIYATSHVFSGIANPSQDAILSGLIYTETPGTLSALRQNDKPSSRFPRLYDMGMDALILAKDFQKFQGTGQSFRGKSGNIRFSRDGSLHRALRLAQFRNGVPVPF